MDFAFAPARFAGALADRIAARIASLTPSPLACMNARSAFACAASSATRGVTYSARA